MSRTFREQEMQESAAAYMQGKSLRVAAAMTGVSPGGLRSWLQRNKVDLRGRTNISKKVLTTHMHKDYQAGGLSLSEIAKKYGVHRITVRNRLHKYGFMTFTAKQMRTRKREERDKQRFAAVVEQLKEMRTLDEIARRLKMSNRTVARIRDMYITQGAVDANSSVSTTSEPK
jgi:transposase